MAYLDAACRARYARLPRVHLGRHPAEVSIHARPGRGARRLSMRVPCFLRWLFQSTRAPGGARDTEHARALFLARTVSIHARPGRGARLGQGGDFRATAEVSIHARPGRGARPEGVGITPLIDLFQSTRAPGGARDPTSSALRSAWTRFNPRAPREGRATAPDMLKALQCAVSIHARPGRGARRLATTSSAANARFQSTRAPGGARDQIGDDAEWPEQGVSIHARPGRGARPGRRMRLRLCPITFQSTRAPGGARDRRRRCRRRRRRLFQSTRAPGGARDNPVSNPVPKNARFQSTRAPGGARDETAYAGNVDLRLFQSTRAPGGARDRCPTACRRQACCFNPRAPREGRATSEPAAARRPCAVSIHARPGRGARPARTRRWSSPTAVSIHARPGRGARLMVGSHPNVVYGFQSTRAPGGARDAAESAFSTSSIPRFQSTRAPGGARDPVADKTAEALRILFQSTRAPGGARDSVVASPGPCGHFLPPSANLPRQGCHCDCAASSVRRSSLRRAVLGAARSSPVTADAWGSRITPPARRRSRWRESARARAPRSRAHRPAGTAAGSLCRGR
jgi:hypothetical protein